MTTGTSAFSPEAVLFDCDGTVLLTAELHYEAMAAAAARQGLVMPRDWYMALTGLGRGDTFRRLAAEQGAPLDLPRVIAESVAMTVALAGRARENGPVAGLARALSGRVPVALVTNSEAVIVHAFLRAVGIADLFDAVLTVDDVAQPKPAPDLYLAAAQCLGVAPGRCLVLEDSAEGVAAARAAGALPFDVRDPDWLDAAGPFLCLAGLRPGAVT